MDRLTEKANIDYTTNAIIHTVGFVVKGDRNVDYNNALKKLYELENTQEEIGCSLKILQEIKKSKQIYINVYTVNRPSGAYITISKRMYDVIGIDILNNQIQCLAQYSNCYMEFYVPINAYKVDWFLKEDKSE